MVSRRSLFKGAAAGLIAAGMGTRSLLAQLIAHSITVGQRSSTIFELALAEASEATWVPIRSRKARPFGRPLARMAPSWVR